MDTGIGVELRRATLADAAQLAVVRVASWQAAYRGLLPQDYLDRLDAAEGTQRWLRELRVIERSGWQVLVAGTGDSLLGFTRFGPTRDDGEDQEVTAEIAAIYVLPEAWGTGVGRRLMTSALDCLAGSGFTEATLWVLNSNERARRFYRLGGWTEDGSQKLDKSYGFPISEMRYRKPLPCAEGRWPAVRNEPSGAHGSAETRVSRTRRESRR